MPVPSSLFFCFTNDNCDGFTLCRHNGIFCWIKVRLMIFDKIYSQWKKLQCLLCAICHCEESRGNLGQQKTRIFNVVIDFLVPGRICGMLANRTEFNNENFIVLLNQIDFSVLDNFCLIFQIDGNFVSERINKVWNWDLILDHPIWMILRFFEKQNFEVWEFIQEFKIFLRKL